MTEPEGRTWYLTAIAAVYLAVGAVACGYYASLHFRADGPSVPLLAELLCLGVAVSAGLYFRNARVGRLFLVTLTALTLVAIGTSGPKATAFHVAVLLVLMLPLLTNRRRNEGANHDVRSRLVSSPP